MINIIDFEFQIQNSKKIRDWGMDNSSKGLLPCSSHGLGYQEKELFFRCLKSHSQAIVVGTPIENFTLKAESTSLCEVTNVDQKSMWSILVHSFSFSRLHNESALHYLKLQFHWNSFQQQSGNKIQELLRM